MASSYPLILKHNVFTIQLCVPKMWTDSEILAFAERLEPSGTSGGWHVCRDGDLELRGSEGRITCENDAAMVHVVCGC